MTRYGRNITKMSIQCRNKFSQSRSDPGIKEISQNKDQIEVSRKRAKMSVNLWTVAGNL